MPPAAQLVSRMTPRGWLIAGGATIAAILFIYLFVHTVSQPSYTTLVSGVEASKTAKMTIDPQEARRYVDGLFLPLPPGAVVGDVHEFLDLLAKALK